MTNAASLLCLSAVALANGWDLAASGLDRAADDALAPRNSIALPAVFAEDLKYTPTYSYLVAVMRPAKMSQLEGVKDIPGADFAGPNPVKPSEVERFVIAVYPSGSHRELSMSFTIQLRNEIPQATIVAWLSPRAQPFPQNRRVYLNPERSDGGFALGFPDNHTVLVSKDANFIFHQMERAKVASEEPHSLATAFVGLDPESHAAAAVNLDKLIHFVRMMPDDKARALREAIEPLAFAKQLQLSINLARPDGLVIRVENDATRDPQQLGASAKAVVAERVARVFTALQESVGERLSERIASVQRRAKPIFEATALRYDRNSCTIISRQLPPAAESLELVSEFMALHTARLQRRLADFKFRQQMLNVSIAMVLHEGPYNALPRDIVSKDGKPLLSWRVAILPHVDAMQLYERFHLDEPWDSEHNLTLLSEMPQVYQGRGRSDAKKTSIQRVTGDGTAGSAKTLKDIKLPDKTVAIVESKELVEWTRPQDLAFTTQEPRNGLPSGGAFAIMCNGEMAYLSPGLDSGLLRAAVLTEEDKTNVERLTNQDNPFAVSRPQRPPARITDERMGELLAAVRTGDEARSIAALEVLQQAHPTSSDPRAQPVVDLVTPLLESKSPLMRGYALKTILTWRCGANVPWERIAEMLKDQYEWNRWLAIDILSEFAEPAIVRALLRLPDQDQVVSWLPLFTDHARIAPDAALPLLRDPDFIMRARACYLIGNLGENKHVGALEELLKDEHEICRQAAQASLDSLKKKGPLRAAVDDFHGDFVAALRKVAKGVEVDAEGRVIAADLDQFNTPYRLVRSDYPLLGKLRQLKRLHLTYSSITAADVRHLKGLPIEELSLNYCSRLDDAVADTLHTMTSLRVLRLDETKVGDDTAKAVGGLKDLRELDLFSTRVGDRELAGLGRLPQLEILNLSQTRISDRGLAAIAQCSTLRKLYLMETQITDASVEHLVRLKNLEFMNLSNSGVTAEGLARLRAALPQCEGLK